MLDINSLTQNSSLDLGAIGARFGLSPEQTRSAMGALLPSVAGGFQKRVEADDIAAVADVAPGNDVEPDAATGNAVLGQIFGSKDVSRKVAAHAAGQSGMSETVMKALLPIVAGLAAQQVAKRMGGGGALGGMLGSVLGGAAAGGSAGGGLGGLGGLLGGLGGGSGGAAGTANPLDDILGGLGLGRR